MNDQQLSELLIDMKSEIQEMIESACRYDNIDSKLQKIVIDTHKRILENTISLRKIESFDDSSTATTTGSNHFGVFLNKNGIEQITRKNQETFVVLTSRCENFVIVKDPRFGWGPNNTKHYLLVPQELALKAKALNYLD